MDTRNGESHPLDDALSHSIRGKFDDAYAILKGYESLNPQCLRVKFNLGWYLLREGKLQEGMQNLVYGRWENVFGNSKPDIKTPVWDGKRSGTVLYYLEGGLGDQIHALKYVEDIAARGCTVVVACSRSLFPVARLCKGVSAVVDESGIGSVMHDWWVPSMSVLVVLGYEYSDIRGVPHIPKITFPPNTRPRIGLRWQGNPQFEHEQFRQFPTQPFFSAMESIHADFVSLQRDEGADACPSWVEKGSLHTWETTRMEISRCDLVISSCTSVAHLSASMGVETWILVPVLPYYLWAMPGDRAPYYDSVTLFRQEKFGCWQAPINKLRDRLAERFPKEKANGNTLCAS